MNASTVGYQWHPTHSTLRDFCSGKIDNRELQQTIEDHLQNCQVCLNTMQHFESDSFELQLQELNLEENLRGNPSQRYELLDEIGRGGAGVVYRARQAGLDRVIALKMLLRGGLAGRAQLARFRRESAALARLSHPHVVQVFDYGEMDGAPFLAMEYINGPSLADRLDSGPLDFSLAAKWLHYLADAVACAHDAGIFHRDLKPQNILLARDRGLDRCSTDKIGNSFESCSSESSRLAEPKSQLHHRSLTEKDIHWIPKLVDFGLAQCQDASQFQTATGETLGTPSYMAPEAINGRTGTYGLGLVDVYGLGAVLYECLTGRPPFAGSTTWEILDAVSAREPASITSLRSGVPHDLVTICSRCLEKDPKRRFPSARAMAEDLERFLNGNPILSRRVSFPERVWRWAKRRPASAAASLLGSTLVLAVPFSLVAHNRVVQGERNLAREQYAAARSVLHDILGELKNESAEMVPEATRLAARQTAHATSLFQRLAEVDDSPQSHLDLGKVQVLSASVSMAMGDVEKANNSLDQAESRFRHIARFEAHQFDSLQGLFEVSVKRAMLLQSQENWQEVNQQLQSAGEYLRQLKELTTQGDQVKTKQLLLEEQWLFQTKGNSMLMSGDNDKAKECFHTSLGALEKLREMDGIGAQEEFTLAGVRINLASAEMQLQENAEAARDYEIGLSELESWAGDHAKNSKWVEDWSVGILNQSSLLMTLERQQEAFDTLSDARKRILQAIQNDPGRLVLKKNLFMVSANRAMFCPHAERIIECWQDAVTDATESGHLIFARQMLVRVLAIDDQPQSAFSELIQIDQQHLDDQQRFVQASCYALISKSSKKLAKLDSATALEPLARQTSENSWQLLQELLRDGFLNEVRIEHLKTTDEWDAVRESVTTEEWELLLASTPVNP